jgi:hypothetical protein
MKWQIHTKSGNSVLQELEGWEIVIGVQCTGFDDGGQAGLLSANTIQQRWNGNGLHFANG